MKTYIKKTIFEHQFWLKIMEDHAILLSKSFYPNEKVYIRDAKKFISTYAELNKLLDHPNTNLFELTRTAKVVTQDFHRFQLTILNKLEKEQINSYLSPPLLTHLINELEEYELVMKFLEDNSIPPTFHELHQHLLWLLDSSFHEEELESLLHDRKGTLQEHSKVFMEKFDVFYVKAVELTKYLKSNISNFPALTKFHTDVRLANALFQTFLNELEGLEVSEYLLDSLSTLIADHMYREERYYLGKLAETTKLAYPIYHSTK